MAPSMQTPRRPRIQAANILMASLIGICECNLYGEPHSDQDALSAERIECPRSWANVPLWFEEMPKESDWEKVRPPGRKGSGKIVARETDDGSVGWDFRPPNGQIVPAGPITDIPEFHDCQRFITPDGADYDSLFAIFASFELDTVTSTLAWDNVAWTSSNAAIATVSASGLVTAVAPGVVGITAKSLVEPSRTAVAAVIVSPDSVPAPVRTVTVPGPDVTVQVGHTVQLVPAIGGPTVSSRAAATIYSYGPGYDHLGIGPNFNCLYVYFDTRGVLTAKMVKVNALSPDPAACLEAVDPQAAQGETLSITKLPGGEPGDVPPVARWDRDPSTGHYFIGIMCNDGWCEIGRDSDSPSTAYLLGSAPTAGERVVRVKGWYDEQELAWQDSAGAPPEPSKAIGTVIPAANLGDLNGPDAFKTFVPVAYVALDVSAAPATVKSFLKDKLNINPVSVLNPANGGWDPTRLNRLELCFGTRESCEVTWTAEPEEVRCDSGVCDFFWESKRWWVKITAAGEDGNPKYRCVTRRGHAPKPEIPGTTRWRWILEDETIWTECTQGCCQTETSIN